MADKKYELTFGMTDGSEQKVSFTVPVGADGKTAYEYAQDGGYTGTEEEFAAKLAQDGGGGSTSADAVLYTPQTLTEAQKTQARTNIGAGVPVNIDTTLSTSGMAADAKAVGDKITEVQETTEQSELLAQLALPGSLKWDGVIGNREYVDLGEEYGVMQAFVHLYDDDLLANMIDDAASGTINVHASLNQYGSSYASIFTLFVVEDGFAIDEEGVLLYVPSDGYALEGITFPKRGLYVLAMSVLPSGFDLSFLFINALVIEGHVFPDQGGGGSEYFESVTETGVVSAGDTITWNGVIGDKEYIEAFGVNVRVADVPVLTEDELKNAGITGSVVFGDEVLDGFYAYMFNWITSDILQVGLKKDAFEDPMIALFIYTDNASYSEITFPKKGIYFTYVPGEEGGADAYLSSLTIPGYNFTREGEINKTYIKEEHLPKGLRFGRESEIEIEDGVTIAGSTISWDGTGKTDSINPLITGTSLFTSKFLDEHPCICLGDGLNTPAQVAWEDLYINSHGIIFSSGEDPDGLISDAYDFMLVIAMRDNAVDPVQGKTLPKAGLYAFASNGYFVKTITFEGADLSDFPKLPVKMDAEYLPSGTILISDPNNYLYSNSSSIEQTASNRKSNEELRELMMSGEKIWVGKISTSPSGTQVVIFMMPNGFVTMDGFMIITAFNPMTNAHEMFYSAEYTAT